MEISPIRRARAQRAACLRRRIATGVPDALRVAAAVRINAR